MGAIIAVLFLAYGWLCIWYDNNRKEARDQAILDRLREWEEYGDLWRRWTIGFPNAIKRRPVKL